MKIHTLLLTVWVGAVLNAPQVFATTFAPTTFSDPVIGSVSDVNSAGVILVGAGAGQISLRSAVIAANSNPGPDTIALMSGTYTLAVPGNVTTLPGTGEGYTGNPLIGDLDVKDSGTTITGAGITATTITQTTPLTGSNDRVLEINPDLAAGFTFTLQNLTITGGKTPDGGGAIVAGSQNNTVTLTQIRFLNNNAFGAGSGGGAVQFLGGGSLAVQDCLFEGNSSGVSSGGAIDFFANPASGSISIQTSTFNNNSATSGGDGGAIRIAGNLSSPSTITKSAFTANSVGGAAAQGGALSVQSSGSGLAISLSRFFSNAAATAANGKAVAVTGSSTVTADDNWWGSNSGPAAGDVLGITPARWLQLRQVLGSSTVSPGGSTSVSADLLGRNTGGPLAAGSLNGLPSFTVSGGVFGSPVLGSLSGAGTQFVNGAAAATFTADGVAGTGSVQATADSQVITTTVQIPTSVTSITRVGANPTGASTIEWDVILANPVNSLVAGNFSLTGSGVTATISGITATTATPASTWRVTATITAGFGTLGLNMVNGTGASAEITNLPFTGEVYNINAPPVPGNDTITRLPGRGTKVSIAQLLSNDTDPDGPGPLVLTLPGATSANGAPLTIEGGWVIYSAPMSGATDTFQYSVTDVHGGMGTGTVTVLVQDDNSQSQNILSIITDGTDKVLRFAGIPGISYDIQYTDDLNVPAWTTLATVPAGSDGVVQYRDVNPPSLSRFYRTHTP